MDDIERQIALSAERAVPADDPAQQYFPKRNHQHVVVRTLHIRRLLDEAVNLADQVDGRRLTPGIDERLADEFHPDAVLAPGTIKALERAVNLAQHAAAELEDELLRARDGWTGP